MELKYASKRFGVMSSDERKLSAYQILLKIHTITGWTIPISELMDVLVEQFELKLSESYSNVNSNEIEYAFRNKGIEIKDWGKALNLTLIDEVMIPYLESRFEISKVEETLNKPIMIEDKTELTEDDIQEWVNDWISKDFFDMELLPLCFYDHLVKVGCITVSAKEKWEYTEKATNQIKVKLHEDINICKTNDAYIAFNKFENMEKDGFTGEMKGRILNRAKRLIIQDYIKSVKNA